MPLIKFNSNKTSFFLLRIRVLFQSTLVFPQAALIKMARTGPVELCKCEHMISHVLLVSYLAETTLLDASFFPESLATLSQFGRSI